MVGIVKIGRRLAPLVLAFISIAGGASAAYAREFISEKSYSGGFRLADQKSAADIFVADSDWKVAKIAASDLALDIERVTGRLPAVKHTTARLSSDMVLVGTIGRNPLLDRLIASGRVKTEDIKGQWESFVIQSVANPFPGVRHALIIAGSDRRGTAYGVFELSQRIGVSPWYWWADVAPRHHPALYVSPERVHVGAPAVQYRGIFINDEMWSIRPWAEKNFAPDEGRGLGPKTYARVFELLLRMRANYLWPAMQSGTAPFNSYPQNKQVADDYAIVMGSSHIEPMLRNNMGGAEWDKEGGGDWNYETNSAAIRDYWARRLIANGKFENIYTLGMRGRDDEPMKGGGTVQRKISLMEQIFADQRDLLTRHVNPEISKVPQAFIPYTEVLGLYDAGLKVPDDVIICWPDDNFGHIRRLPTPTERARPGGSGVYYHIQWLDGATDAYTWLYTTPPALIWEEMNKAWEYGARKLWVLNVGGLKPREAGIEFFLNMAWDPKRWRSDNTREYFLQWAARDLDSDLAPEIASIMEEHCRLSSARRPEHLVQYRNGSPLRYSWFSTENYNDEAQLRLDRYSALAQRTEKVYNRIPQDRKDAFFELVLYPVQCAALMNEKIINADKCTRYASQGRASASEYAQKARAAEARIGELTEHYNRMLLRVGNKWNYMMTPGPGPWGAQGFQFKMPPLSEFSGSGSPQLDVANEGGRADIVPDLSVYTQGRRFIDIFNKGVGPVEWEATASQPWLRLDRLKGRFTTEQRVWVSVDWSSAPKGDHSEAFVDVTSNAGNLRVTVPIFNPAAPSRDAVKGFVESHGYVCMEANHFTRRQDRGGAAWQVIKDLGRSSDSMSVFPPTGSSHTESTDIQANSPSLDYDFYLFSTGKFELQLDGLPTQPVGPGHGVRLAISLDGGKPQLTGDRPRSTSDVLANLRRWSATVLIEKPGHHTLTVWMVDPGVMFEKIVLYTIAPKDSGYGPPESYRRGGAGTAETAGAGKK